MELDCVMFENVVFDAITDNNIFPISLKRIDGSPIILTKYGEYANCPSSKCVIFPKGKTTWEGFVPPCEFKDGDIVATKNGLFIGIVKLKNNIQVNAYCAIGGYSSFEKDINYKFERFATEEEKARLFKAITDNGYRWNAKTKTLEKLPKFKVGDRVRHKTTNKNDVYEISKVYDDSYGLVGFTWIIYMKYQDYYELVPGKFEINTLVPFESRVLVRDCNCHEWVGEIFTRYADKSFNNCNFVTLGGQRWKQCIPYNDDTKYLLGTTNDCNDYYKTW